MVVWGWPRAHLSGGGDSGFLMTGPCLSEASAYVLTTAGPEVNNAVISNKMVATKKNRGHSSSDQESQSILDDMPGCLGLTGSQQAFLCCECPQPGCMMRLLPRPKPSSALRVKNMQVALLLVHFQHPRTQSPGATESVLDSSSPTRPVLGPAVQVHTAPKPQPRRSLLPVAAGPPSASHQVRCPKSATKLR